MVMKMSKKIKQLIDQINNKKPVRSITLNREDANKDERTIPLAFSSEEPFERWWGIEILDHSPESVDLSRLNNSAPILSDHDHRAQIGVVEPDTAIIDADRKGRLVARFGSSDRAEQEFRDVLDGIRTKVSVGYRITELVLESEKDGVETYRVKKWQPFEVSLVSVPADDSVGVGRSHNDDPPSPKITIERNIMPPEVEEVKKVDVEKVTRDARAAEMKRLSDINTFKAQFDKKGFDLGDLAEKCMSDGSDYNDFRNAAFEKMQKESSAIRNAPKLDLNEKEVKQYSLLRAIHAQVTGDWRKAGFERECSDEISKRASKQAQGIFVPTDIQSRAQNVTVAAEGGNLVGTNHNASSFIDMLKDNSVVSALGATHLEGLIENQQIPKKTGASTGYWLGEAGDVTDSEMTFGFLSLTPKTVAAAIPMTRRMLKQGLPSIEALAWADMAEQIALAIDIAALEGDGTGNQPTGIVSTAGVNTANVAIAGQPTWPEIVGFETAVAADNALQGAFNYVTTAAVRGHLKTTVKDSGSGLFLMENGDSNGYNVALKNALTLNRIIFGNFSDLLIGHWGVLDVMPDEAELAKSGGLVVRAFQDLDIAVRRPESFCINTTTP